MLQNHKGMQRQRHWQSLGLLFGKYTYFILVLVITSIRTPKPMFKQLAGRLDLAKSSFSMTRPCQLQVTVVDYRRRTITSDRQLPAFSQLSPVGMPLIQC